PGIEGSGLPWIDVSDDSNGLGGFRRAQCGHELLGQAGCQLIILPRALIRRSHSSALGDGLIRAVIKAKRIGRTACKEEEVLRAVGVSHRSRQLFESVFLAFGVLVSISVDYSTCRRDDRRLALGKFGDVETPGAGA